MTLFGGWRKCDECDVRWDSDHAGANCWNCGKPGEKCFSPQMSGAGYWLADRNDPLPDDSTAA